MSLFFGKSDAIVPCESQDIKNIYGDSKREYIRIDDIAHTTIVNKISNDVPKDLSGSLGLSITHAICENQTTSTVNDYNEIIPTDTINWTNSNGTPYTFTNSRHPIVQFNGFTSQNDNERWPQKTDDKINASIANGRPVILVGTIDHYFMNRVNLKLFVNGGPTGALQFNNQFGKWSGQYVDINGDNVVNDLDHPTGSFVFAPVDKNRFVIGENLAWFEANSPFCSGSSLPVSVEYGNPIHAYESDQNGDQLQENQFFNGIIEWETGTPKTLYVCFDKRVSTSVPSLNRVKLVGETGENNLVQVYGEPGLGQFSVIEVAGKTLFKIRFDYNNLLREDGKVKVRQVLHLQMQDENSGEVSNCFKTFLIDQATTLVAVQSLSVPGDFNGDGFVNEKDQCETPIDSPEDNPDELCLQNELSSEDCSAFKDLYADIRTKAVDFKSTYCDNSDNNFNGKIDPIDKSEITDIQYFSPVFVNGKLISPEVPVNLAFYNDMITFQMPFKKLTWTVFKVNGDSYEDSHQLIYSKDHTLQAGEINEGSKALWSKYLYSDNWKFTDLPSVNQDGLYCIVASANMKSGKTAQSLPAYFIIDTKKPTIKILQNWKDENGGSTFGTTSETYSMKLVPGDGSTLVTTDYDSEADNVIINFKPFGNPSLPPYTIEVPVDYNDYFTYNANGEPVKDANGVSLPDGKIDPTTISISKTEDELSGSYFVPDGIYDVTIEVTDKAGNKNEIHQGIVVLDRGAKGSKNTEDPTKNTETVINNNFDGSFSAITNGYNTGNLKSDQIGFIYFKPGKLENDFEVSLQVKNIASGGSATSGLMVRSNLEEDSKFLGISVTQAGQVVLEYRLISGQNKQQVVTQSVYVPPAAYLKVVRQGTILYACISSDNNSFIKIDQIDFGSEPLFVGGFNNTNGTFSVTTNFSDFKFGPNRSSFLFPLKIEIKDEAYNENNITKPSIRITNLSPDVPLTNFKISLWFSREEVPGQEILADKYYTEPDDVQMQLNYCPENNLIRRVDLTFPPNYSLLPGATTSDPGIQLGVHFNNYYPGQWVKGNDWSCSNLTNGWKETQKITVYDRTGKFIYGCEPDVPFQNNPVPSMLILGCESLDDWSISQGSVAVTNNKTEGLGALEVSGNGYQELLSRTLRTGNFTEVTNKIAFDLFVGNNQPNPYWAGNVSLYVNCPSAGIYNLNIGDKNLTDLSRDIYSTVEMNLPSTVQIAMQQNHYDFTFTLILNTNQNSGPYRIDNVRFVSQ